MWVKLMATKHPEVLPLYLTETVHSSQSWGFHCQQATIVEQGLYASLKPSQEEKHSLDCQHLLQTFLLKHRKYFKIEVATNITTVSAG